MILDEPSGRKDGRKNPYIIFFSEKLQSASEVIHRGFFKPP